MPCHDADISDSPIMRHGTHTMLTVEEHQAGAGSVGEAGGKQRSGQRNGDAEEVRTVFA